MGRDKAALLIDGEPLWQRQLATLRATHPAEFFISGKSDGPYAGAGLEIVPDETPGLGPLGGLVAALQRATHPRLLVLAIDLPAMSPDFLATLLDTAPAAGRGVVPADGGWFEPLAAVYPRASLPLARECLLTADHSLQTFVRRAVRRGLLRPRPLADEERPLFRNLNTPGDLPLT